jgi:hypothetical protein
MHMRRLAGVAVLTAIALPAANAGERAEYSFRSPLDNGRGVTSLQDLHGKPVLIDFWGTR